MNIGLGMNNGTNSGTMEELEARFPELREKFLEKYKDNIEKDVYHQDDLDRIKTDDTYVKCFLRSVGDMEKAVERIDEVLVFRKNLNLQGMTEEDIHPDIRERNPCYYKGTSLQGNKILLFKLILHKKGTLVEESKRAIAFRLDQFHKEHAGERIIILFDFTSAGVTNMDLDVTKFIISCVSTYFPAILAKILMFEMPFLLSAIWAIIKGWLDKEQKEKVQFVKKGDIQKYISADQLEPHMVQ